MLSLVKTFGSSSKISSREGRSIIMSSQHLEEADALADRIAIMTKGKILKVDGFSGIGVPE